MDYENCKYFLQEDITPWHGDIFDHPSYTCFCIKDENKKELAYPEGQCKGCMEKKMVQEN